MRAASVGVPLHITHNTSACSRDFLTNREGLLRIRTVVRRDDRYARRLGAVRNYARLGAGTTNDASVADPVPPPIRSRHSAGHQGLVRPTPAQGPSSSPPWTDRDPADLSRSATSSSNVREIAVPIRPKRHAGICFIR